jgi:gas vesicle protein
MSRFTAKTPLAFVGGTLLGFVVGTVIGVFFAPAKGARTRRQLARRAEALGDRATEIVNNAFVRFSVFFAVVFISD